ncbi:hypothetical protein Ciccas_011488, partial [Cichlidogyrus casuarinus]
MIGLSQNECLESLILIGNCASEPFLLQLLIMISSGGLLESKLQLLDLRGMTIRNQSEFQYLVRECEQRIGNFRCLWAGHGLDGEGAEFQLSNNYSLLPNPNRKMPREMLKLIVKHCSERQFAESNIPPTAILFEEIFSDDDSALDCASF